MGLKFPSLKEQNGDATIFLAMMLALGVGTAVYYNMDKLNQQLKVNKVMTQKDRAETRNLSGLSQAAALMSYSGTPQADQAATFPYIFPDPYLPGAAVGQPRNSPNADTWAFAGMKLTINSPLENTLQTKQFSDYIFQEGNNNRPALTSKSTIQFLRPVYAAAPNDKLITGYAASVTSNSFDAQNLVSRATIPVPPPATPKCVLSSLEGPKYQPNAPMHLTLSVSGVALEAGIPESTEALVSPANVPDKHTYHKISDLANSIRRINSNTYSWTVTAPRPLMAVDGDNDVQFETFAYLVAVDNNSQVAASCSFKYAVTPPATCKLWTDKATVSPGQCVNITSGTVGPVRANSLVMSAVDPTDKAVAGLTQNGANAKFCTPAVSSYSTGTSVPKDAGTAIAATLSGFTMDQEKALYGVLADMQTNLQKMFKQQPDLQTLSMGQYNELWDLGPAQLAVLDVLDLGTFTYLNTLTPAQQAAFHTLKPSDLKDLDKLSRINLSSTTLLSGLSATTKTELMGYDSAVLMSYLGTALDQDAAATASAIDYRVTGKVTANDGTTSSCVVHVTAGTNKCDFYGSQFPNKTQKETVVVNYQGRQSSFSFDFAPSKPNWEVAGVATSPTNVDVCPSSARCYAIDNGSNRTPFVVVYDADQKSCNAVANQRIDLGCFAADTKIRMGDGTDKAIRELKEGDKVYNPLRKASVGIKRITPGPERIPLWTVQTAEGMVRVTSKHPFLTADGLKQTVELKAGDRILGSQGEQIVQSVAEEKEAPQDLVWNFVLDVPSNEAADHAILADGVVTGDLYLQEELAREKNKALTQSKP